MPCSVRTGTTLRGDEAHLGAREAVATLRRGRSHRARSGGRTRGWQCPWRSPLDQLGPGRAETVSIFRGAGADPRGERAASRLGGAESGRAARPRRRRNRSSPTGGAQPRRAPVRRSRGGAPDLVSEARGRSGAGSSRREPPAVRRRDRARDARRSSAADRGTACRAASCAPSCALNCDWPPGRCTNSTSWRAVINANVPSEIVVDQREREIHAGGHTGRRPHVAVAYEDRVGVDRDAG